MFEPDEVDNNDGRLSAEERVAALSASEAASFIAAEFRRREVSIAYAGIVNTCTLRDPESDCRWYPAKAGSGNGIILPPNTFNGIPETDLLHIVQVLLKLPSVWTIPHKRCRTLLPVLKSMMKSLLHGENFYVCTWRIYCPQCLRSVRARPDARE
jgi:hypothetical protein